MRLPLFVAAALAGVGMLVSASVSPARANGVPQLVKLTYLDGVSNFGPKEAEGVLEFSFAEAYARVDVKNLPPQTGMTLEGWMLGPGDKALFVGDLSVNGSGIGSFEAKLTNLDSYDYDLFLIAARPAGATREGLPEKKSIAGRFVVLSNNGSSSSPDVRPALLPDTGEAPAESTGERMGRTLLVMAITACCTLAAIRLFRRRRST